MSIEMKNPHSVLAALVKRPRDVVEVRVRSQKSKTAWDDVVQLAMKHNIPVRQQVVPHGGGRRSNSDLGRRTATASAIVKEHSGTSLKELFADVETRDNGCGLWLALDCLQDPHNVGAVFRSAAFYDVAGVIMTKDRSAPLNGAVYDVASGGMEYVPFAVETNLSRTLDAAKEAGVWVLGTSERAKQDVSEVDVGRPWLLVLGNEEKGLRRLTAEKCDEVCKLTARGGVGSLNVSVAAGILVATLQGRKAQ